MRTMPALLLSLSALACGPVSEEDPRIKEAEIEAGCSDYCEGAVDCIEGADMATCEANCKANVEGCAPEDLDEVLADLDNCAASECTAFGSCTVGATVECAIDFGF